jgi:hypothetical protein
MEASAKSFVVTRILYTDPRKLEMFRPKSLSARRVVACVSLAGFAASAGGSGIELRIRAPESLQPIARELEQLGPEALAPALRLTGLEEPGAPIEVVLAAEGSSAARGVPSWISGYAHGDAGVVVLLPARLDRYPDRGLVPLLRHEVTHVLIARAARGGEVPRWFDEGLALTAGRGWELGDRARVALAVLRDDSLPLTRIDRAFAGGESEMHAAYALAGDVVRELVARYGAELPGAILARVGQGERFETAFRTVAGASVGEFERAYWKRRTLWDRWLPVVSSSVVLWAGVAFLAVAAFRRRATRDAERLREWDDEERRTGAEEPD